MEAKDFNDYCLKRLEALEKENADLKLKLKTYEEEGSSTRSSELYYKVSFNEWYIGENNYKEYERALEEGDYSWLYEHDQKINSGLADYEVIVNNEKYLFRAQTSPEGHIDLLPIRYDGETCFKTYAEAKENLAKQIRSRIKKYKPKPETDAEGDSEADAE